MPSKSYGRYPPTIITSGRAPGHSAPAVRPCASHWSSWHAATHELCRALKPADRRVWWRQFARGVGLTSLIMVQYVEDTAPSSAPTGVTVQIGTCRRRALSANPPAAATLIGRRHNWRDNPASTRHAAQRSKGAHYKRRAWRVLLIILLSRQINVRQKMSQ